MTSDERLELVESCVALRREGDHSRESVRRALASIEQRLAGLVGPLVRKRVAARLLGVSVQALDHWVAAGRIPTEPIAPDSRTHGIPTTFVIDLAVEQSRSGETALQCALDDLALRQKRSVEFQTAHNLTTFSHEMTLAFRSQRSA